jgi:hypothetical protein
MTSQGRAQAIETSGTAVAASAQLTVEAEDAITGEAGLGPARRHDRPERVHGAFRRPGLRGRPLRVCLIADSGSFCPAGLAGGLSENRVEGRQTRTRLLARLARHTGQSLLGSLGKAFSRASLFRSTVDGQLGILAPGRRAARDPLCSVAFGAGARADNAGRAGAAQSDP